MEDGAARDDQVGEVEAVEQRACEEVEACAEGVERVRLSRALQPRRPRQRRIERIVQASRSQG